MWREPRQTAWSSDEIACEKGAENLLSTLRSHFAPHLELSLPRAFERAVYGQPRGSKESIQEYLIRVERAFFLLSKEGLNLDETAKGYVAYRQASLTEAQDLKFSTWSKGQFDWKTVVSSLRRLDTVIPTKSSGGFLQEGVAEVDEEFPVTEPFMQEADEATGDEEQYILVEEGDLDKIYEEDEAQLALATYQEVRRAINVQQKNRQYFGGGKGRGPPGKSGGKFAGRRKIHIEELKLRTRCGRCGLIGHWAKECTNAPDQRGQQRSLAQASTASSKASSAPSQQSWYVAVGEGNSTLNQVCSCFGFSCRGIARNVNQGDSYQSQLLGSQEMEAGTEMNLSGPVDFSARPIGPCQQFEPTRQFVPECIFLHRADDQSSQCSG